ncbi:MAG: phosphomannomutase/phosphoglucomutase [Syntrophomonadaceae bacterium]|jgi:phosphomannomutase/phosphoglucomutase
MESSIMNNIFRQYDIRGIVDNELSEKMAYDIACAFSTYAIKKGQKTLLLGRDNRASSPAIAKFMIEGALSSGCDVIDLGMVITPIFYFASRYLNIPAGIMITASHNPPDYNGCKLLLGDSTIYGEQIQEIRKIIEQKAYYHGPRGSLKQLNINDAYSHMINQKISLGPHKLKVVVDCGNGTASLFAPSIFRKLGCEVVELYCESDSSFPNHHPDPINPENMKDLIEYVKMQKADLGIGIDGDGDRLGVVDNEGNLIWGDMLMIIFWREIMPRYPGTKAIVEVKCSQALIDEIKRLGGEPVMFKTGHSLIKAKMKELGAVFTGEMSGHMFFGDNYYGFDDAIYASARLLSLLSHSDKTLPEMLADVPRYYSTPEIRIPSDDIKKFEIVNKVLQYFKTKYQIIDVDGARIIFPHGWGLVRASNTGPELIVRCEANSPEALSKIKDELFSFLQQQDLLVAAI